MKGVLPGSVFVAVFAGLIWYNIGLQQTPIDVSPIHTEQQASAKAEQSNAAEEIDGDFDQLLSEQSAFLDRPLFHPDRRPFVPLPPVPAEPEPELAMIEEPAELVEEAVSVAPTLEFKLYGINVSKNVSRALIAASQDVAPQWLEEDAVIEGWRVKSISGEGILIEADGESRFVALYPKIAQ